MPLAGKQLQPRDLAAYADDAFKKVLGRPIAAVEAVEAVAVCLAESQGYDAAWHDNQQTLASCQPSQVVLNPELYIPYTVVNPATGLVRLSDGSTETHPPESLVISSRDVGLWQINIPAKEVASKVEEQLYDPTANAQAMARLYEARLWQPWAAYNSTVYLFDTFLGRAARGVGNWLADQLLQRPAQHQDGSAYVHAWTTPVVAYQFQVEAAVAAIQQAETDLGWTAKTVAQVVKIHQDLAHAAALIKQTHP